MKYLVALALIASLIFATSGVAKADTAYKDIVSQIETANASTLAVARNLAWNEGISDLDGFCKDAADSIGGSWSITGTYIDKEEQEQEDDGTWSSAMIVGGRCTVSV